MKVLVTGGSGFLGLAICKQLLEKGYEVCTLNRHFSSQLDQLNIQQYLGNISVLEDVLQAAQGIDAIVHTAAKAGAWGKAQDYYDNNVRGTENIVTACRLLKISKLVYTSSPSVVHNGRDLEGVDESVPYAEHFLADYPKTKAIAEQRVLAANSPELATVALRPHLIWGPSDPHFLPRILDRAKKGQLRFIGSGKNKIDTVFVENAAEAHILALEKLTPDSSCAGKAYFITQGEPILLSDMINTMLKAAELPPETRCIPLLLATFLGNAFEWTYRLLKKNTEPPLTRFLVDQLSTAHWFNIEAARRDLGYSPRITLAEGMRRLELYLRGSTNF